MNAIVKTHGHVLQNNTVLKELYSTNSFIFANKRGRTLPELVARADHYNIKTDLVDQNDHGCYICGRKCDSEKTTFLCFATGTKFKIRSDSTCITKSVFYT